MTTAVKCSSEGFFVKREAPLRCSGFSFRRGKLTIVGSIWQVSLTGPEGPSVRTGMLAYGAYVYAGEAGSLERRLLEVKACGWLALFV